MITPPKPPPRIEVLTSQAETTITADQATSPFHPPKADGLVHVVWAQNCSDCTNFAGQMAGVLVSADMKTVMNGPMTLDPGVHFYTDKHDIMTAIAFAAALKVILGYETKVSIDSTLRSPVLAIGKKENP